MKRSRPGRRSGIPNEAEYLLWLSNGLADSGSRAEDCYWEEHLAKELDSLLSSDNEETLGTVLDHLYSTNTRAYDVLADMLETQTEQLADAGEVTLLLAAPILAWSRFSIPATTIPETILNSLRVHLQAHVLAKDIKLVIADVLFSPDQLPQGYCDTKKFLAQISDLAATDEVLHMDVNSLAETSRFLSDLRYILAAVRVKTGAPLFRWQEQDGSRDQALKQWQAQGGACLLPMLAGCAMEVVLPDAYFAACRQADKASRAYSVRASVAFLSTTLEVTPDDLCAVVAPFYERQLEEYRIGFTTVSGNNVVHGVVWPLLGPEDDIADIPGQIEACLKECGVSHIEHLDSRFPMEYCEDCGAPMYPSREGEAVHAELPEDKAEQVPKHLH